MKYQRSGAHDQRYTDIAWMLLLYSGQAEPENSGAEREGKNNPCIYMPVYTGCNAGNECY